MAAGGGAAGRMLGADMTPGLATGMGMWGLNAAARTPKRDRAAWLPA